MITFRRLKVGRSEFCDTCWNARRSVTQISAICLMGGGGWINVTRQCQYCGDKKSTQINMGDASPLEIVTYARSLEPLIGDGSNG